MSGLGAATRSISHLKGALANSIKTPTYPDFALRMREEILNWHTSTDPSCWITDESSRRSDLLSHLTGSPEIGIDPRLNIVSVPQLSAYLSQLKTPKHIALLHSLANIEYSAVLGYTSILLMPSVLLSPPHTYDTYNAFFTDILSIVDDECRHFISLLTALDKLGAPFGSLPVNNNIRADLTKTDGLQMERLVLVSLLHEGRGLDGGERVVAKVPKGKDRDLLAQIVREEERHVGLGVKWVREMLGGEEGIPELLHRVSEITGVKNSPERMDFDKRALAGFKKEWAFYNP